MASCTCMISHDDDGKEIILTDPECPVHGDPDGE